MGTVTTENLLLARYRKPLSPLPAVQVSAPLRREVEQLLKAAEIPLDSATAQPRRRLTRDEWVWLFNETSRLYQRTDAETIAHLRHMTERYKTLGPELRALLADEEAIRRRASIALWRRAALPAFLESFFSPLLPLATAERLEDRSAGDVHSDLRLLGYISYVARRDAREQPTREQAERHIGAALQAFKTALEEERYLDAGLGVYTAWTGTHAQQLMSARDHLLALKQNLVRYELWGFETGEKLTRFTYDMMPHAQELFPLTHMLDPARGEWDEELLRSFRVYALQHPVSFTADLNLMKTLLPQLRRLYGDPTDEELWTVADFWKLRAMVSVGARNDPGYLYQRSRDSNRLWVGRLLHWVRFVKEELGGDVAQLTTLVANMHTTRPWLEALLGRLLGHASYRLNHNDDQLFRLWRFLTHEYAPALPGRPPANLERLCKEASVIAQWPETAALFSRWEQSAPFSSDRRLPYPDRIVALLSLAVHQHTLSLNDNAMRAWLQNFQPK